MFSESQILSALAKYCSQAERCVFDVQNKLKVENLSKEAEQRIIEQLQCEKFIDERRFAKSYVHDKFQLNHWGRLKIAYELKMRGIPSDVYYDALETIDEDEYNTVLAGLLTGKKRTVKGRSPQDVYQKLYRFAVARGFEAPVINNILRKICHNND